MKLLGIIPARFASTRFPGKPLADIHGKSMIRRVYEQACKSTKLTDVIIATDDDRILAEADKFGGQSIRTSGNHQSGTDRCAEVAGKLPGFDIIINIQGDEPFIDPAQIDLLASCFDFPDTKIATLVKKLDDETELFNPNIPKVILGTTGLAIYFSRNTIPYIRSAEEKEWLKHKTFYKHIGIYGYQASVLQQITKLAPSSLELAEQLEQLRWIENGYPVQTRITIHETIAVDTPADLERVKQRFNTI